MKVNRSDLTITKRDTIERTEDGAGVGRYLKRKARVTEEQLFGAAVAERLQVMLGDEASDEFQVAFRREKSRLRNETGKRSVEQAALSAMQMVVDDGVITESERDKAYNQAFQMAQFDDDSTTLEDGREPAKAITTRDNAISMADAKSLTVSTSTNSKPFSTEPTSVKVEQEYITDVDMKGFVWKPVSESDGKLVVLAPNSLAGRIKEAKVFNTDREILDEGRFAGNANGGRDHFRFNMPGGSFGSGSYLEFVLDTGGLVKVDIDNPSERFER
jgi:hypothetical protein